MISYKRLPLAISKKDLKSLEALIIECVDAGAEISFMSPMTVLKARNFWKKFAKAHKNEDLIIFAAYDGDKIVGTVSLVLSQPENQPHRGDIAKMMVYPHYRRNGIAEQLLLMAHKTAKEKGKTVLTLDTASNAAEKLYEKLGYIKVGSIPNYALTPFGQMSSTCFYYIHL